jgi:hypothetical protein
MFLDQGLLTRFKKLVENESVRYGLGRPEEIAQNVENLEHLEESKHAKHPDQAHVLHARTHTHTHTHTHTNTHTQTRTNTHAHTHTQAGPS